MSPEVAALLGSGIAGLVTGGLCLFGGFMWGRAKSDAQHAAKRNEALKKLAELAKKRRPSKPAPAGKDTYTHDEMEDLIEAAGR